LDRRLSAISPGLQMETSVALEVYAADSSPKFS